MRASRRSPSRTDVLAGPHRSRSLHAGIKLMRTWGSLCYRQLVSARSSVAPHYGFFILNRHGVDSFCEDLVDENNLELTPEYIIFQSPDGRSHSPASHGLLPG